MAVTVNFRNNTDFFAKISGIEEVITPNSQIEDKTIQWVSNENKQFSFFGTEDCGGAPLFVGTLSFVSNDGIFLDRGTISGPQTVKLYADKTDTAHQFEQTENGGGGKFLDWSLVDDETVLNLNFDKIS